MTKGNNLLTGAELDFLKFYRNSVEYQREFARWQKKRLWRISTNNETTDGRNILIVEALENTFCVTDRIIVEADRLDEFVERTLECAERVRAAEQERGGGGQDVAPR